MAVKPVVYDDSTKKHRPLGSGEKMDGLSASSIISADSGNLIATGSDGLAYATGSGIADPSADNLLEATPSGKLKMDADRLAEWLDGHPADAKTLSEAIKVVSGDSGNVISKGSDKGAYLSSASLANVISGMSASQLQQLAAALADGKTIVASNGKLTVDPTNATAAQLTKISAALRKSGGGLSVGSDGKLSVDFASMSASTLSDLIAAIIKDGGGLAVDGNGQIYVDFDTMPKDDFENMLKSLKMLVPLSANMDVFVDAASGNDTAERTTATVGGVDVVSPAFKTIQTAVNYVTRTYAVGSHTVRIRVRPGTYSSAVVTLPDYSRTTGVVYLIADDLTSRPIITNSNNLQTTLTVSGGYWNITGMNVRNLVTDNSSSISEYPNGLSIGTNAIVNLRYTSVYISYADAAPSHSIYLRGIAINTGGVVYIVPHESGASSIEVHKGNASSANAVSVGSGGSLWMRASNIPDSGDIYKLFISGEVFATFNVEGGSVSWYGGEANRLVFAIPSDRTLTGSVAYVLRNGGSMYMKSTSPVPGTYTGDPIVESATYSWYAVNPNI